MGIRDFLKLYGALLVIHLGALYVDEPNQILILISKPLLLFSLLAYVIHKTHGLNVAAKGLLISGLFFALAGDVFLMIPDWVLPGMGAFLLCQIAYAGFFTQNTHWSKSPDLLDYGFLAGLLTIAGFVISRMSLPAGWWYWVVSAYALALLVMVWIAFLRRHSHRGWAYQAVFLGALLFLISDTLLASHLFSSPTKFEKMAVMAFYGLGQLGIVFGSLKSQKEVQL
jgi:uncharacterized membrane protein YhhN